METSRLISLGGLVISILAVCVAAVYNQGPHRQWEIKWLNFLGAVVLLELGGQTVFIRRITDDRPGHSVTLTGAAAVVVGCLILICGVMLATAAVRRRQPEHLE